MKVRRCLMSITIILEIIVAIPILYDNVIAKNRDTYKILVDVESSRLYLFKNDILEKEYKCAGGKPSTPSPIGTWTIISKQKWGEGFGGRWMRV